MKKELEQLKQEFEKAMGGISTMIDLDDLEQRFFSRKSGEFTAAMKKLKDLSDDARKEAGKIANDVKGELEKLLHLKRKELGSQADAELAEKERIDVTQPALPAEMQGHIHPITQAIWELSDVARSMGMIVEDGPELDSDYYVFESLNLPPSHPARDSQDTFYIKGSEHLCMRSHVSNMQARLMHKYGAPLRAAHPGRVYRNEALDATHAHTFYQFDVIVVDKGLSIGNLVATIKEFLKRIYHKDDIEIRLRPAHFPFVEPGFEMDMKVDLGKGSKWIEVLGCGMIHPNVIREGGLDPDVWDGYAFSFGMDRLVMAKYGIEDIRHFHSGDLRFLSQF